MTDGDKQRKSFRKTIEISVKILTNKKYIITMNLGFRHRLSLKGSEPDFIKRKGKTMKKLISVLMALSLLLVSFAAFAEERTGLKIDFNEMKDTAAKYEGKFVNLSKTNLMMYVPNSLKEVELSEKDNEEGHYFAWTSEDGKVNVDVSCMPIDINAFVAEANKTGGATGPVLLDLNDVKAWAQNVDSPDVGNGTAVISLPGEKDTSIIITFAPTNDEAYAEMLKVMYSSIQLAK